MNVHIAEFAGGNIFNHDPLRNRKLLLHKKELKKLQGELTAKGVTLVPLKMYLKHATPRCSWALLKGSTSTISVTPLKSVSRTARLIGS